MIDPKTWIIRKLMELRLGGLGGLGAQPAPPGLKSYEQFRQGNWGGAGYSARVTSPPFLGYTSKEVDVKPDPKSKTTDGISKIHDIVYNLAQQNLLNELLDTRFTASEAFAHYYRTLAVADKQFLEEIAEFRESIARFDRTGDISQLPEELRDRNARDFVRISSTTFELYMRWNRFQEHQWKKRPNSYAGAAPNFAADLLEKLEGLSNMVDGQVVGDKAEYVRQTLIRYLRELKQPIPNSILRRQPLKTVENSAEAKEFFDHYTGSATLGTYVDWGSAVAMPLPMLVRFLAEQGATMAEPEFEKFLMRVTYRQKAELPGESNSSLTRTTRRDSSTSTGMLTGAASNSMSESDLTYADRNEVRRADTRSAAYQNNSSNALSMTPAAARRAIEAAKADPRFRESYVNNDRGAVGYMHALHRVAHPEPVSGGSRPSEPDASEIGGRRETRQAGSMAPTDSANSGNGLTPWMMEEATPALKQLNDLKLDRAFVDRYLDGDKDAFDHMQSVIRAAFPESASSSNSGSGNDASAPMLQPWTPEAAAEGLAPWMQSSVKDYLSRSPDDEADGASKLAPWMRDQYPDWLRGS